ncbi:aggregation-promoting factor C-terminal-like domain-containing protein [Microbacterium sp. HJ5]
MLENRSSAPARAPRSHRLASLSVATGLVLGLVSAAGLAAATPTFAAEAVEAAAATLTPAGAGTSSAIQATAGSETLRDITSDARDAVGAGRAALAAAGAVQSDIATAGLDLGAESTAVDVVPLLDATGRLAELELLPVLLLPAATEELVDETQAVEARVAELRARLDAALEKKAAEEAAAKAKREAEEAAAEAARAAAAANTVDGAKATAARMASAKYGWGADQFSCLESLWTKESGWNYQAYNASSGATGIPQSLPGSKMATAGADWQTNATTQIAWGLDYIARAYGSPCSAWGHSQATDWY